ncbi:hypothetical protein AAEX31_004713 [Pseudomonas aeruginosa]|nr:hypothetical protein [Pseudomonas aeruginosa]EIU2673194.1 hypothetical protein [Pseudomonas aeruginosa]EIU2723023.1 hypothetical protein [Pseudomonas aeruginosa]EIU3319032.1 hypothetical protein [Pseudomonas aeruginosa]EIU3437554.1 hypothetical protein [Pseudomonas aeruginosa]
MNASERDKQAKKTLTVIERHARSMGTNNPKTIAADYAEDAVVMGTIFSKTVIGRDDVETSVAELLKNSTGGTAVSDIRMLKHEAVGEYGYLVFESDTFAGTETYVVRNGSIAFESCTIYPKT